MRILVLISDAFGCSGGIALYNRDLLKALCTFVDCTEVVAVPRLMQNLNEPTPSKLTYITDGINSKGKYTSTVLKVVYKNPKFDLIICGHINLLPIAYIVKLIIRAPLLLEIYGIEAWKPSSSQLVNLLINKIDAFISISEISKERFLSWSKLSSKKGFILPNAIHTDQYGIGPKNKKLLKRYGLNDKIVLMTLGRLVSRERYKGFDEIIELLPELSLEIPDITYLIVGDGNDRQRLVKKVTSLGIANRVIFTGVIPEAEKADHYRLADVYVMPSRGEGFGFVFLEAMACGIPVVASKEDGSREAVKNGELGILVDSSNPLEIKAGILQALKKPKAVIPEGLEYFSFNNFVTRTHQIITEICLLNRN